VGLEGRLRNGHKYRDAREIYRLRNMVMPRLVKRGERLVRKLDDLMALPATRIGAAAAQQRQERNQGVQRHGNEPLGGLGVARDQGSKIETENPSES
jgi:hypothetical protein